jgi:hypothetical protein
MFGLLIGQFAHAVIIDRIAVRVGNAIIKDSDISRIVRVTEFLNDEALNLGSGARREASKRLVDQAFIRQEIRVGDYPRASWEEADAQIDKLKKSRFKSPAAFQQALAHYGLVEPDLRFEFQWQLTVLRFIDLRFKPAVLVTEDEIAKYYKDHLAELRRANPGKSSLEDLHDQIQDVLTGERVNKEFFAWLDDQRKTTRVEFHEESLR